VTVTQAPVNLGFSVGTIQAKYSGGRNKISVTHRELLTEVAGLSAGGSGWNILDSFDINPGDAETFPWLATQAWSWEAYTVRRMEFQYIPHCSTGNDGSIQMFLDYDNSDETPLTLADAAAFQGYVEGSPYLASTMRPVVGLLHQSKPMKWVTPPTGIPAAADATNYNCATMYIAGIGLTNDKSYGNLWVEYTIDLFTPTAGVAEMLAIARSTPTIGNFDAKTYNPELKTGTHSLDDVEDLFIGFTNESYVRPGAGPYGTGNQKGPQITFYDTENGTYELPGPATYSISFEHKEETSATQLLTWDAIPSWDTMIDTMSRGLRTVKKLVDVVNYTKGLYNYIRFSGIVEVPGRSGLFRFIGADAAETWDYTITGPGPAYNNMGTLEIIPVGSQPPPDPAPTVKTTALFHSAPSEVRMCTKINPRTGELKEFKSPPKRTIVVSKGRTQPKPKPVTSEQQERSGESDVEVVDTEDAPLPAGRGGVPAAASVTTAITSRDPVPAPKGPKR
jgi:hypothetical protein